MPTPSAPPRLPSPASKPSRRRGGRSRWLCLGLGAGLFGCSVCVFAQTTPAGTAPAGARPKVCLVLSGGGARGAAHVGVLKVLEEMRVKVDCVVGTSMGSIVGAAYASGVPLDEMEHTLASLSTDKLFKEKPPREERSIRLKQDDVTILASPEIGVRGSAVLLPRGLVSGVQLESVLRQLSRARGFHRFDQLPIPYRAVATDLITGKAFVISQGELSGAMRASMSVPGVIEPAQLDDHLLVDGGLTNNLPVDVARSMGGEVIIAVNLGTPLLKAEQLNSILGVTGQMVNILTEQNVRASLDSLRPQDILISPELGDFSASDFDHMTAAVPIGEAAARKEAPRLAALAVSPQEFAQANANRLAGKPDAIGTVDEIRFNALKSVNPGIAQEVMQTRVGKEIDQPTLDRDMQRLFGTGDFEHVNYRLLEEPGKRVLNVDAVEKSWGPNYLRMGLGLSTDFKGDAFFNLLFSLRKTWMNSLGGEWRTDVQLGRTSRFYTEFYQPVEKSQRYFVVPSLEFERRPVDLFQQEQRLARYDVRIARLALEAGRASNYGELRVGIEKLNINAGLDTGPSFLNPSPQHATPTGFTLKGVVDQLDSVNFPRSGYAGSVHVFAARQTLGSDSEYTRADTDGSYTRSFGNHTVTLGFKVGGALGSQPLPDSANFQWGGLLQQSGYPTGALVGQTLQFARAVYYQRLAEWPLLDGAYAGMSLEFGRMLHPLVPGNSQDLQKSAAAFIGVDTPLGPMYLGYGYAVGGFSSLYFFLGRP